MPFCTATDGQHILVTRLHETKEGRWKDLAWSEPASAKRIPDRLAGHYPLVLWNTLSLADRLAIAGLLEGVKSEGSVQCPG